MTTVERPIASQNHSLNTQFSLKHQQRSWAISYSRLLRHTDGISIIVSVALAQVIRFGTDAPTVAVHSFYSYTLVSVLLILAWFASLSLFRSREPRVLGTGPEEYRRVAHASGALFGTVAVGAFLLDFDLARGYLAVALPLGVLSLVLTRYLWRRWLRRERVEGRLVSTVLVVGSQRAATSMAEVFEQSQAAGYRVVGVCVPGLRPGVMDSLSIQGRSVPVLGDERSIIEALGQTDADMVAVSHPEFLGADGMRALAWQLEDLDVELVVAPGVADVAVPRLQIRPVAGLPLLHLDKPQYRGAYKMGKRSFDLAGAVTGLLVLSPILAALALLIKIDSPGPVFYRSQRIGLNGKPFAMMKFRSMTVDADVRREALLGSNEGSGPLFKMRNDPRVTRVGRWLRRLSLDELPQLLNVVRGQMSVVGPRPPLLSEVMTYTGDVHRRLLVKPGITGLWQVSGRSNLSWDASVRLDLFYVENWSLIQDVIIVARTFGAVARARGAY